MTDTKGAGDQGDRVGRLATFALSYAQLCQIAYDAFHDGIPAKVAATGAVHVWNEGTWACVWGPVADPDDANLVYVAKFTPTEIGSTPTYVVVVRGTDLVLDGLGDLDQLVEDLDIGTQQHVAFPGAPQSAVIAQGTLAGLDRIKALSSGGHTLCQFVVNEMTKYAGELPRVVVTGHSLGGCLTTVVAPYLLGGFVDQPRTPKILPYTFAGPSAGNQDFADYFDKTFAHNYRYFNTSDIIPHWWASPAAINTIYPGSKMELGVKAFFDIMDGILRDNPVSYAQPSINNVPLHGALVMDASWKHQASRQHHISTYIQLLQHN